MNEALNGLAYAALRISHGPLDGPGEPMGLEALTMAVGGRGARVGEHNVCRSIDEGSDRLASAVETAGTQIAGGLHAIAAALTVRPPRELGPLLRPDRTPH